MGQVRKDLAHCILWRARAFGGPGNTVSASYQKYIRLCFKNFLVLSRKPQFMLVFRIDSVRSRRWAMTSRKQATEAS